VNAIEFSRQCGYRTIILWTVQGLPAAAHLYQRLGFVKVEETEERMLWGVRLVEERHELTL